VFLCGIRRVSPSGIRRLDTKKAAGVSCGLG